MSKTRFTIFLMLAMALVLLTAVIAQADEGEFLILSAQYGSEYHHVDVTGRLKELAARDRTFRVTHDSMRVDPDEGHQKVLRIYARGPNGGERMFEFVDGAVVDGAMFRAWGRGEWGTGWSGNWNGAGEGPRPGGDQGEFLILSAQYGSERRHVDVTGRLKELARHDRTFRLDFRTFGVDPDEGHQKFLRIYARGPAGRERMFEYVDGAIIDGARFRGWGSGEWGSGWSGRWEAEREERERERERDHQ